MIREVQNLGRAFEAAGKPILQALVEFCQEPTSRAFQAFSLSKIPSLPVSHPWNLAKDQKHEVPKSREF